MKRLHSVLQQFEHASRLTVVVWTRRSGESGTPIEVEYGPTTLSIPPVVELLHPGGPGAAIETPLGCLAVAAVPGRESAWLGIADSLATSNAEAGRYLPFLLPVVGHYLESERDSVQAAEELAERYEEINLLYTTSEILGRTVSLEEAAARILAEISETVSARRAAILVHDRMTDTLQVVSAIGFDPRHTPPIAADDGQSVAATVLRERKARLLEAHEMPCEGEAAMRHGSLLAVPILWTNPGSHESIPLGVVTLSERRNGGPFRSTDEKLVSAIGTQIGTAIQNARLVRASLAQQQLNQEMQLASDLQMKLLPDATLFAPEAKVAAQVLPADSVGGDFYHLFRLGGGRTGVMIGDVSSHGYRAALVMALVMSAASIHAQSSADPAQVLDALLGTLRDELESTEMSVSVFYAVIDPARGRIRYANAGHPHAFIVDAEGAIERLGALDPPLGMSNRASAARERQWASGRDLLLVFTDGLSDARNRYDARLGEQRALDLVRAQRKEEPAIILEQVLSMVRTFGGDAPRRDDLTLLLART
ncbi:MAG: PP2C family protein-serine/threonine phosphatase [Gemmatimonadota bacterium]